jgi:hypothetical protein
MLRTLDGGYSFTCGEVAQTFAAGFSGIVYVKRHKIAVSREGASKFHHILAKVELLPTLGGVIALIERIAVLIFDLVSKHSSSSNLKDGRPGGEDVSLPQIKELNITRVQIIPGREILDVGETLSREGKWLCLFGTSSMKYGEYCEVEDYRGKSGVEVWINESNKENR